MTVSAETAVVLLIAVVVLIVVSFSGLILFLIVKAPSSVMAESMSKRITLLEAQYTDLQVKYADLQAKYADLAQAKQQSDRELDEHKKELNIARRAQNALLNTLAARSSGPDADRVFTAAKVFSQHEMTNFRTWLARYFDRAALALLAADVGVHEDDINADTVPNMAQNLIDWCGRYNVAQELREAARRARPTVPIWAAGD